VGTRTTSSSASIRAGRHRRLVLALAAALVVSSGALIAGCGDGGGDENGTTAWASSVCTDITNWANQVQASVDSLRGGNLSKATLEAAAADVKESTDTLGSELTALGKPDTASGEQAQTLVTDMSTQLSAGVESIQKDFSGASDASGVLAAAGAAATTLKSMASSVSSTVSSLKALDSEGELKSAFEDSSECQDLSQRLSQVTS
jgi:hypothetical protein